MVGIGHRRGTGLLAGALVVTACTCALPPGEGRFGNAVGADPVTSDAAGTEPEALRPESIVYRRSGGIAGMEQTLEVRDTDHLVVTDRRLGELSDRDLTEGEGAELRRCLDTLASAGVAGELRPKPVHLPGDPYVSDAFQVSVHLDGAEQPALTAKSPLLPIRGAGAWDDLLAWLDARVVEALESGAAR